MQHFKFKNDCFSLSPFERRLLIMHVVKGNVDSIKNFGLKLAYRMHRIRIKKASQMGIPLSLYHNNAIRLRYDYDEKIDIFIFCLCRIAMPAGARDTL